MELWQQQLMLERMETTEEALTRAREGKATEEDWKIIYLECGLEKKHESDRISR